MMTFANQLQRIITPGLIDQPVAVTAKIDRQQLATISETLAVEMPPDGWIELVEPFGITAGQLAAVMKFLQINDINLPQQETSCQQEHHERYTLMEATQQLLRQHERWSSSNQLIEQNLQLRCNDVLQAAHYFSLVDPIIPSASSNLTDAVLVILGGGQLSVEKRMGAVIEAIKTEALPWPSTIIAATGYRKLLDQECPDAPLKQRIESEMMAYCWQQLIDDQPLLQQIPFKIISAKLKPGQQRSVTVDSVQAVAEYIANQPSLQQRPVVIVTYQPFSLRPAAIFIHYLVNNEIWLYTRPYIEIAQERLLFTFQDEIARFLAFILGSIGVPGSYCTST